MSCCSSAYEDESPEIDGECPDCGGDTDDGYSVDICTYSPVVCDECGDAPCDGSC